MNEQELAKATKDLMALAEKIAGQPNGAEMLAKALSVTKGDDKNDDKDKDEKDKKMEKAMKAAEDKEEEAKEAKDRAEKAEAKLATIQKTFTDTPSKGGTANKNPEERIVGNFPEEVVEGMKEVNKAVQDLCGTVAEIKKSHDADIEQLRKAIGGILGGMGLEKALNVDKKETGKEGGEKVEKGLNFRNGNGKPSMGEDVEKMRETLEAAGFKVSKGESDETELGDAPNLRAVRKSRASDFIGSPRINPSYNPAKDNVGERL